MKVSEIIFEAEEWENKAFTSRMSELAHLEGKRKAVEHHRKVVFSKMLHLASKGIIVDDPTTTIANDPTVKFVQIPGTGSKETNYKRLYAPTGQPEVVKLVREIELLAKQDKEYATRIKDLTIKGHSFCFTGFRDSDMEQQINRLGGTVTTSAVKDLNFLVAADTSKMTGKMLKAKQNGAKIVSKQQMDTLLKY